MDDCLIIGGGAIGLAIGWELAQQGASVQIIDAGPLAHESSWAGAGIFPPAPLHPQTPYDKLLAASTRLFPKWCAEMHAASGIDPEHENSGALWLAQSAAAEQILATNRSEWKQKEIEYRDLSTEKIALAEPALNCQKLLSGLLLPGETQARNPRICQALATAITRAGGSVDAHQPVTEIETRAGKVVSVTTPLGKRTAKSYCLATGAWSLAVGQLAGLNLQVKPIRGQIALLKSPRRFIQHILYESEKYIVPRLDGHALVGSTVEDVGFDKSVTSAIDELLAWARALVPGLRDAEHVQSWSGLRPCATVGRPYLGRAPRLENLFVATGHFRAGLHLAPITARVISQLIRGECPEVDLASFAPS